MDDTLRNVAIGLAAFLVLHVSLEHRAKRGAERQVFESFNRTGHVSARLQPRGWFGLETSDFWAADVYGEDLKTDKLPFYVYPRKGWKGSIRHLRLHLKRLTLAGLPVRAFEADIPSATFDIGQAVYKSRLVLRGTGSGAATVTVDADGLRAFIGRKFSNTLFDVNVHFVNRQVIIEGNANLLGNLNPISTTGVLVPREGRYLDITEPQIRINGTLVTPLVTRTLIKQFNPVLDLEADLGLGGYFVMERVDVGDAEIVISGRASVPIAPQ